MMSDLVLSMMTITSIGELLLSAVTKPNFSTIHHGWTYKQILQVLCTSVALYNQITSSHNGCHEYDHLNYRKNHHLHTLDTDIYMQGVP